METRTLRERQRLETRQRILGAAIAAFGRDGFAAVRTQDIAAEAGVSHGSVFAHFGSREALIAAVIVETVVDAANQVRHELKVARGLQELLHAHLAVLAEHEGLHAHIVAERASLPAEVQTCLTEVNSGVATYLFAALEREAVGPSRVAPHMAFNAWMALVAYYLMNRDLFAPGRAVLAERAEELVGAYLAMIT